ncbi:MAG: CDP-glucose 4,6-dehydratase, partial [Thaumarchaeota archaeon]
LTGHTGFKGSWLSIWLKKLGVELIGFSKDIPTEPSLFELAKVSEDMKSIIGDIRDFSVIQKIIQENQPEIIIHMAAQALVRKSYEDPLNTFSTNIMGTANLLESLKQSKKTRVVINVTSDKCYENNGEENIFSENSPMGGYDPYSSSKGCSELITSAFKNSFYNSKEFDLHKLSLSTVRAGNVIGGGDWAKDRLIPDIINSIVKKIPTQIRNTESVRPWQFVLEPLQGYLILAEKMWKEGNEFSGAWNFGPDNEGCKSVKWILEKISKNFNNTWVWENDAKKNPHEASMLKLDCNKAKKRLNWKTKLSIDETLEWTINWYKEFLKNSNMKKYTENQINRFVEL